MEFNRLRDSASGGENTVIFVALSLIQARFYLGLARQFERLGHTVQLICLHEGAYRWVKTQGISAVNFYEFLRPVQVADGAQLATIAASYGIANVNRAISHEKAAYEIRDGEQLALKLVSCLEAMSRILQPIASRAGGRVEVIQELGGFIPVIAAYTVTARLGLQHTFMEPSFFRRRTFFVRNSFAAPVVPIGKLPPTPEVESYLLQTIDSRQIVIPDKDRHHYRSAASKVLSARNARRLVEKLLDKYVRGRREEFGHISSYVRRHVRMLLNERRVRRHYEDIPATRFVYYPLHVPADVALTIRAPEFLDQFALLEYLARSIPATHVLAVKEHPALIGAITPARVDELMRAHDNVFLINPSIHNHDVIRRADLIVTVNSKSGAEALMLNRPVLVLGDAFYANSQLVTRVDGWNEIEPAIRVALQRPAIDPAAAASFFQSVWDQSFPGEIYADDEANCVTFTESLLRWFQSHNASQAEYANAV